MWVYLPFGFFSVVQKSGEENLTIRARVAGDLDELRVRYMPSLGPTIATPNNDYAYRAKASHAAWAQALSAMAKDLNYSNVKSATHKTSGHEREHVYHEVHSATCGLSKLDKGIHPSVGKVKAVTPLAAHKSLGGMQGAYGGVVFDSQGRVLLFEPKGHFDQTHWAFPKGKGNPGESPEAIALREVLEEAGAIAEIVCLLPGEHKGTTSVTRYFLMNLKSQGKFQESETESIAWCGVAEARLKIAESKKASARKNNDAALNEAVAERAKRGLPVKP